MSIYDIIESNYFVILNLLITILNSIFLYALAGKLNNLNQNLYNTFKYNKMLDYWNKENFYLDEEIKDNEAK